LDKRLNFGPGGLRVYPNGGENCRELRADCMHKEGLGEAGQGNCRRYREICRGGARYYHPQWREYRHYEE